MPKYNSNKTRKKFDIDVCTNKMTFEECEIEILRQAVKDTEDIAGKKISNSEEMKKMITIVEEFIQKKKLLCYGGTAINNILPKHDQFYNYEVEIPDYDFYSANALEDAKELADIYHKNGYSDVEAKSGMHYGTFKVYVNFIPIADITYMHKGLYDKLMKESITIAKIHYAPANFLRMSMYLELSRPAGDVSRWEKVFKRLQLLNKHFPLKPEKDCETIDFQRSIGKNDSDSERLYLTVRDSFVSQGVVFFGGYATHLYSRYMLENERRQVKKIPDFDVLSEDIEKTASILKEALESANFHKIKTVKHEPVGEIIPQHIEIKVDNNTIACIYKPIACHSYNKIHIGGNEILVATIDTILAFYLSFTYASSPYYNKDRLLCMAKYLFEVERHNRLERRGLLKRFSINCYGKQTTMQDIRAEKAEKHKELSKQKNGKEYEMRFLKYSPKPIKPPKNVKITNIDVVLENKGEPVKEEVYEEKDETPANNDKEYLFGLFPTRSQRKQTIKRRVK